MHVTLIHNPGAGLASMSDAGGLRRLIESRGHTLRYQSCASPDWADVLDEQTDLVVIAGGDGTVGRVAKALTGRAVPFTVLPIGTANNIAKTLGLTLRRAHAPLASLVDGWDRGTSDVFDVGVVSTPWARHYFIEGFGAGLLAATMPVADASKTLGNLKDGDARVTYALRMLLDRLDACAPQPLSVTVDGRDLSGEYLMFEAMNMQFVGPNLYLAPACDLHDGLLDVLLVPAAERETLRRYLYSWQHGTLWPAELPVIRCRRIELEWTGFPLHLDDCVWPPGGGEATRPQYRISVSVRERALLFLVPGEGV